jgi:hypothetical protein
MLAGGVDAVYDSICSPDTIEIGLRIVGRGRCRLAERSSGSGTPNCRAMRSASVHPSLV